MKKLILLGFAVSIFFPLFSFAHTPEKTLRVGLNPWIGTAIFYIAKDKHFFQQEKVNVELIPYDEGASAKQLINTGQIDILFTTPETVVVLKDHGLSVKVVAALDSSKGADGIIANKDIQRISDLKGKTVALEPGSSSHLLLSYFLAQHNLSTKDLTIVNFAAPDAGAAFVAGRVDAAVTWEPWLSKAAQREGGHRLIDSSALPLFPDFVIVRNDTLSSYPDAIRGLLKALFRAQTYLKTHPVEAQKIVAEELKISPNEVRAHLKELIWLDYQDNLKVFSGNLSPANKIIQQTVTCWYSLGLITKALNYSSMIDASLLPKLYS